MATRSEIHQTVRAAHDDLLRIRDQLEGLDRSLRTPLGRLAAAVGQTLYVLAAEFPAVAADASLDALIEHPGWNHPAQAILRPRPSLATILEACDRRLAAAEKVPPPRLHEVRAKLLRAIELEEGARRRRQRQRGWPPRGNGR